MFERKHCDSLTFLRTNYTIINGRLLSQPSHFDKNEYPYGLLFGTVQRDGRKRMAKARLDGRRDKKLDQLALT